MRRSTTVEEDLALRLCGIESRRHAGRDEILRLARRVDPDELLAVLARHGLVALVGSRFRDVLRGRVPDKFGKVVADALTTNRRGAVLYSALTERFCRVLDDAGVANLPLKGTGLAERAYGDVGLRSVQSDIDLLISVDGFQGALDALCRDGCEVVDNVNWWGGLPHYHSLLVSRQPIDTTIELHWRLHWYESEFAEEALARALSSTGPCASRLEPVDELVTLLLIFARDGYVGLRMAADIASWWDRNGQLLPPRPLDSAIASHPRLRRSLLAATEVLEAEVGIPAADLADPMTRRGIRVRLASRLPSWTARDRQDDVNTNITLNDLLLTPWGAYHVFARHYYLQPLEHYLLTYDWPRGHRLRNHARRLLHAFGRLTRSSGKYARRLWQIRGGRTWEALPKMVSYGRRSLATASTTDARLLIVSPVRNEAAHIERVVHAVAAQTRPPDLWVVADNGSDDETPDILRRLERDIPFMRVVEVQPPSVSGRDRLAQALEAKAFNRALEKVKVGSFTHIGKLDGDIELPPDYFTRLLQSLDRDQSLGITGGSIVEADNRRSGAWRPITAPAYHVHGALKLYKRACFEAIGGIQERLGWDTIDETYARMRGFATRRDATLVARHHRPTATADGKLRGRMRHGECAYIVHYSIPWVLMRSLKVSVRQDPLGISGLAFAWGYARCTLRGAERVDDKEFRRFVRAEHRRRIRRAILPSTKLSVDA